MLATILSTISIAVLPIVPLSRPTADCRLEVLTSASIEQRAVVDFQSRIDAYVTLHRRLARSTSAMPDNEGDFFGEEIRAVLIAARPNARQGGFFTPAVETAFRRRIDRSLLLGLPPTAGHLYAPLPGEPAPVVNEAFPVVAGPVTWQALFLNLPELPPELGYALWGRDLVLVDVVANLVLDVMPEALPDGAHLRVLYP